MRTIFIADAHLDEPGDHNYRLMLEFLRSLEGSTETLLIMGDLFDFWLGFPSNPFTQYQPILDALFRLRQSGCRIVYFEGNHDFHLGPLFEQQLSAQVHKGPAVVTVQEKRLYLCHGDQINPHDRGYRFLRAMLHNRLVEAAVNHFPPSLAVMIKNRLQHTSQAGYAAKSERWDYRALIMSAAASARDNGCDGLVTGHFHIAFCEQLENSTFTVLSLGDWMGKFTYGEMVDGKLSLRCFTSHSASGSGDR